MSSLPISYYLGACRTQPLEPLTVSSFRAYLGSTSDFASGGRTLRHSSVCRLMPAHQAQQFYNMYEDRDEGVENINTFIGDTKTVRGSDVGELHLLHVFFFCFA